MKRNHLILSLLLVIAVLVTACAPTATPTPAAEAPAATTVQATTAAPTEAPTAAPTASPAPLVLKYASSAGRDNVGSDCFVLNRSRLHGKYVRTVSACQSTRQCATVFAPACTELGKERGWSCLDFQLRPNVKFHDGEPMNAAAVVKSIEAAKDHAGASFIWLPLDKVEAVDDMNCQI